MFLTCTGEWDDNTMEWNSSDVTDAYICCTEKCKGPVDFCYNYCKTSRSSASDMSKYRCSQMCEDQRKMCLDTCSLISKHVGKNNEYIECANKLECATHDVNCLSKNKKEIVDCCLKSCTTSKEIDCDKNCNYLHSFYMNQPPSLIRPGKKSRKNSFNFIVLLVFIIIFSLIFLFLIKRN